MTLHNPFISDDGEAMMEEYKIVTHPGAQAPDGSFPDVTYTWDFQRNWTITGPNTMTSELAHIESPVRLPIRIRLAQALRSLAEWISPREDDPDYDYGESW